MLHNYEFIGFAVRLSVALAMLFISWQFILLPTMADVFRQRVFSLRRDMFSMMSSGLIEPTHPAYTHLRSRMNGMLRFAERMTAGRILFVTLLFSVFTDAHEQEDYVDRAIAAVDDVAIKSKLAEFDDRLTEEVAIHIIRTSLICWIVIPIFIACKLIGSIRPIFRTPLPRRIIRRVEDEARCFSQVPNMLETV